DSDGHIVLLNELGAPEIFGEVFACAQITYSPVTVMATENTTVLHMDYGRVITSCAAACPYHTRLIANMLQILAIKSMALNQKIEILSKRTTREKLLCFFDMQRGNQKKFTIPYNREELSNYLCVDRSAMSNELCKMRNQGLIKFQKSTFELI
ncbi:MAG: Crp/Fnr family transcriptional regulator, partial [Lachnospiraceae bacterium]|nr:Crp/Fnr family transcriptional regulator [Lachnospiraceae bacterium]